MVRERYGRIIVLEVMKWRSTGGENFGATSDPGEEGAGRTIVQKVIEGERE